MRTYLHIPTQALKAFRSQSLLPASAALAALLVLALWTRDAAASAHPQQHEPPATTNGVVSK